MFVLNNGKLVKTAAAIIMAIIIAAALFLIPRSGYYLTLRNRDTGDVYAKYRMEEGDRFSISFEHSVNHYILTDIYEICDGSIFVEETKYGAFGAGVQTELNPGEVLSYTDDGYMLISNIHQNRDNMGYTVGTIYDHMLKINDGEEISLRDMCGKNGHVRFTYEFWWY